MRITKCINSIVRGPEIWGKISTKSTGYNIYESLKKHINNEQPALLDVSTKESISYKSLLTDTINLATWLRNSQCGKNDVITVCSQNSVDFFTPIISALYEGVTTATINHAYTKSEILHNLKIVKPKVAFCSSMVFDKFLSLRNTGDIPFVKEFILLDEIKDKLGTKFCENYQPMPSDNTINHTAIILFSSGTTGLPKGVMLSHHNLNARHNQATDPRSTLSYMDDSVYPMPFYHAFGFMNAISMIQKGKTTRFLTKFNEKDFLQAIQDYKLQYLITVPPLIVLLTKSPNVDKYDLSSLKEIICGAAPLSSELEHAVKQRLPNIKRVTQAYGQTELSLSVLAYGINDEVRPGSSGKVIPGHEVIIRDPTNGHILGPNEVGEICAKGPMVMQGYFENEIATKETFSDDGWLRTGDMAYYDTDGYFYVVDRLKELIKFKGFQVAPAELEALLLTNDAIADAGVVGIPDERCGELPVAFVVKKPNFEISELEILSFVEKQVSKAKRLHFVYFVNEIPKNPTGKLLRKELKKMIEVITKQSEKEI